MSGRRQAEAVQVVEWFRHNYDVPIFGIVSQGFSLARSGHHHGGYVNKSEPPGLETPTVERTVSEGEERDVVEEER